MKHSHWMLIFGSLLIALFGFTTLPLLGQDTPTLNLAANGSYLVGRQEFTFMDESRDRSLTVYIYYPSGPNPSPQRMLIHRNNADANLEIAPYPLIFYSSGRTQDGVTANSTMSAAPHLASYGYAVATIEHNDPQNRWISLTHRPLDILFVLDQIAAGSADPLLGLINTDQVGMMGFSFGGTTSLMIGGAQIGIPTSVEAYCAEHADDVRICDVTAEPWADAINVHATVDPAYVPGELWSQTTDPRIKAVMPIAPCWQPIFGERGLASATPTLPFLIVGLEDDEICTYERDALFMSEHIGASDRALLTLLDQKHAETFGGEGHDPYDSLNHFAVAFFGYYLLDNSEYAQYLSADFVGNFEYLAWASTGE